jgi:hypothetical protein
VVKFSKNQCEPCTAHTQCTRSNNRVLGFPPQKLFDLQKRTRTEGRSPDWRDRYATRAGVEGTICELARGHGMHRTRYRHRARTHAQHVLTVIAISVERLSSQDPPRPPTAFQEYLDQNGIPSRQSWRTTDG